MSECDETHARLLEAAEFASDQLTPILDLIGRQASESIAEDISQALHRLDEAINEAKGKA